jgi:hypothetical protein
MNAHKALESLLLSMFSADELRRHLHYLPGGDEIAGALPGTHAAPATLAHEAVAVLARTRVLHDPTFWASLREARPRRAAEIDRVHELFAQAPATPDAPVPPTAPSQLTLLLVSASPEGADRLRVDREVRSITDKLRASRHRDRLRVVIVVAARFEDLRTALLEHAPHVLHISTHGDGGSLLFEPRADGSSLVVSKQLRRLLGALGENLRLVVLGACESADLARELAPVAGCSIGMNGRIHDDEAIEFSVALYETLAFGKSIQTAFDAAVAGLDADDELPRLYPPEAEDPEQRRRTPLLTGLA